MSEIKPKIVVFAGPNGSGKTTITAACAIAGVYTNADDIKRSNPDWTDMDAAKYVEHWRHTLIEKRQDFTFETVLSTERYLDLLREAKSNDYFIRGYYVLTCDPELNVYRVKSRVAAGGHDVPEDKIRARYLRAMKLIPEFVKLCDICTIYDNSLDTPHKIFKKKKDEPLYRSCNPVWDDNAIDLLLSGNFTGYR